MPFNNRNKKLALVGLLKKLSLIGGLVLVLAFQAMPAQAQSPISYSCLDQISRRFELPLAMLLAILDTEAGKLGQKSYNQNGSYDLGPMQINSLWLPKLLSLGIKEDSLRYNGCLNLAVGAWILRSHLRATGSQIKALGLYHSRNRKLSQKYLAVLRQRARKLNVPKTIDRANLVAPEGKNGFKGRWGQKVSGDGRE